MCICMSSANAAVLRCVRCTSNTIPYIDIFQKWRFFFSLLVVIQNQPIHARTQSDACFAPEKRRRGEGRGGGFNVDNSNSNINNYDGDGDDDGGGGRSGISTTTPIVTAGNETEEGARTHKHQQSYQQKKSHRRAQNAPHDEKNEKKNQ